jgi:putative membrane protein
MTQNIDSGVSMRSFKQYLLLFSKGLAMGAADVVPGVSGGTIAFVSGIYMELIDSIKSLNLQALRVLRYQGFAALWRHINGNFLVTLLSGILTSLFSLAVFMQYLLAQHPLPVWSFFVGLIAGSVIYLLRQYRLTRWQDMLLFVVGIAVAWGVSVAPSVQLQGDLVTMFFAGSIALCAMILPGISGSFILVLLGLYPIFITAIAQVQLDVLSVFALGGIIGLALFSRFLSWMLARYQVSVIGVMCGFLVGSLNIIWPWKLVLESTLSHSGKTIVLAAQNLWPSQYTQLVGADAQTLISVSAMLLGLILVLGLEYVGSKFQNNPV